MKLSGKVALVTGANSGIGKAVAFYLAEEGADIVVDYVMRTEEAEAVVKEIETMGRRAMAIKADVSSAAEVKNMFAKVIEEFSTLDILVNNAGIGNLISTVDMSDDIWNKMIGIHLYGTMNCTREALKIMLKKKSGKIINIASICGTTGCLGAAHYSAAKGGIIGFTHAVAREVITQGINVNAVAPGYVDTPLLSGAGLTGDALKELLREIPIGRLGKPREIASLVAYLATEDADFMVGQVISPNGGQVI
ncbi:MAG TPA: 3-oxoacyl-ACP reductase family protein [Candidatus Acidoferrales bacterium]|nr:3-oxoacyl-ACP reductase family protein [Candidatus Acidoferrales bacterium]